MRVTGLPVPDDSIGAEMSIVIPGEVAAGFPVCAQSRTGAEVSTYLGVQIRETAPRFESIHRILARHSGCHNDAVRFAIRPIKHSATRGGNMTPLDGPRDTTKRLIAVRSGLPMRRVTEESLDSERTDPVFADVLLRTQELLRLDAPFEVNAALDNAAGIKILTKTLKAKLYER